MVMDFRLKEITGVLGAAPSSQVYGISSIAARISDTGGNEAGALKLQGFTLGGPDAFNDRQWGIPVLSTATDGDQQGNPLHEIESFHGVICGSPLQAGACQIRIDFDNANTLRVDASVALFHWLPTCWQFGGPIVPASRY